MVHLHNGILHSREKEGAYTLCNGMDGTGEHFATWNKPGGEGQIPYDLTFNWNIIYNLFLSEFASCLLTRSHCRELYKNKVKIYFPALITLSFADGTIVQVAWWFQKVRKKLWSHATCTNSKYSVG